jgi:hypothetical protein
MNRNPLDHRRPPRIVDGKPWLVNLHGHLAKLIPVGLPVNKSNLAHHVATLQSGERRPADPISCKR